MTCRDLFLDVLEQEYRVMARRRDYLAARKLTELSYMLQHPHTYTLKELTLASRILTLVTCDGYFPLDAAEILDDPHAHPFDGQLWHDDQTTCPLNIGNFRDHNEPYLDSAYRWSGWVFDTLVCAPEAI
jgi:hypothetical protein